MTTQIFFSIYRSITWVMPGTLAIVFAFSFMSSNIAADETVATMEEILVTAQRRSESIEDVPIAITVQTAEDLRKNNIVDIRDIGNVVPGLSFLGQGAIAIPAIRGVQSFSGQAGTEQPTAMYIDGIYQPNQWSNYFDLVDIERLEVLKGPQGTLYGRNSMGGAINITTVKPQYETKGKLSVKYGRYTGSDEDAGDRSIGGYVTGPLVDDVLAYSLSVYSRDMEGYLTNDLTGGGTGEHKKWFVRGKLLWEPSENTSIELIYFKTDRDDLETFASSPPNKNSAAAYWPDGVVSSGPWHVASELTGASNPLYVEQESVALKINHYFEGYGTLTSTTSTNDYQTEFTVDLDGGTSAQCKATFVCADFWQDYPSEDFQQEFLFTSDQFGKLSFVAGLYFYENDAGFEGNYAPVLTSSGYAIPDQSLAGYISGSTIYIESEAIFGSLTYQFTDRFKGILGGRYNDESIYGEGIYSGKIFPNGGKLTDDSFSPRIALHYELSDSVSVYGSYTEGRKGPVLQSFSTADDYADYEDIEAFEVGVKSSGDNYRLSAALFMYDYTDFQDQVWDGSASLLGNAESAEMQGLEIDWLVAISEKLEVRAVASWLDTEYGTFEAASYKLPMTQNGMTQVILQMKGDQMKLAPERTLGLTMTYTGELESGELEFSGSMSYSDEYWFDYQKRVKQDSFSTFNASASYTPHSNNDMRLTVYATNLTNKKYFATALLGPSSDAPVYSPPRQIGIALDYGF